MPFLTQVPIVTNCTLRVVQVITKAVISMATLKAVNMCTRIAFHLAADRAERVAHTVTM